MQAAARNITCVTRQSLPYIIRDVEAKAAEAQVPALAPIPWHHGLPRTVNPFTKIDDTEAILTQCENAWKVRPHNTEDQVNAMRRKLFMGIVHLRTKSRKGYILDPHKGLLPESERSTVLN